MKVAAMAEAWARLEAPSFWIQALTWCRAVAGLITSELAPALIGRTWIRAHGSLDLQDDAGNKGALKLSRKGEAQISITGPGGATIARHVQFAPQDVK
jgi:hypothetical protein